MRQVEALTPIRSENALRDNGSHSIEIPVRMMLGNLTNDVELSQEFQLEGKSTMNVILTSHMEVTLERMTPSDPATPIANPTNSKANSTGNALQTSI